MQEIRPAPALQQQQERLNVDSDLRAALQLATGISPGQQYNPDAPNSSSASPHEHNIDPSIGGQGGMMSTGTTGGSGDDDSLGGDGRKGKSRELSQSKRAAQNRQAQRAFRQRKEGYIKKLEEQVREHHTLEENYKQIQAENYSLREYIIHLQSRLIDNQQEFPEPPPNVNLSNPQQRAEHLHNAQQHHENNGVSVAPVAPMTQLQQAATRSLAVAGLKHPQDERPYEQQQKRFKDSNEESSVADEQLLRSQLQGGSAHGLPISN